LQVDLVRLARTAPVLGGLHHYEAVAPEFFVTSFPRIRRSNRGDLLKRLS
jgi:hypothetical protein